MHKTVSLRLLFCGKRKVFHLLVSVFAVCTLFVSGFYREIPQEYSQIVCDESTDRIYGDPEIPEPVRNTQTVRNLNGTEWQLLIDARELKLPKTGRLSRAFTAFFLILIRLLVCFATQRYSLVLLPNRICSRIMILRYMERQDGHTDLLFI